MYLQKSILEYHGALVLRQEIDEIQAGHLQLASCYISWGREIKWAAGRTLNNWPLVCISETGDRWTPG